MKNTDEKMMKFCVVNKKHYNALKKAFKKQGFDFSTIVATEPTEYPCYLMADDSKRLVFVDEAAFIQSNTNEYFLSNNKYSRENAKFEPIKNVSLHHFGYVFLIKELIELLPSKDYDNSSWAVPATPTKTRQLNQACETSFKLTDEALKSYYDFLLFSAGLE